MDIFSLAFNELQKKIMQERKKHLLDDLIHLATIKDKVILMDTKKNVEAISKANLAYARADDWE